MIVSLLGPGSLGLQVVKACRPRLLHTRILEAARQGLLSASACIVLLFPAHSLPLLYVQGKLAVLDCGVSSPLHALLHEGTEPLRTVYEEDFGRPIADVLLLRQPHRRRRSLAAAQRLEQHRWTRLIKSGAALTACSSDVSDVYISY